MSWLYTSKDIVCCTLEGRVVAKEKFCVYIEGLIVFFTCLTFTSAGVHDLHPARCLLPY